MCACRQLQKSSRAFPPRNARPARFATGNLRPANVLREDLAMCGIAGEIRFDGSAADPAALTRMNAAMRTRGPDSEGIVARGRVALGHRRLRIIDLSDQAEQPMVDAELGLTIVFNGAIYNYRELRQELEATGYRFFSHGDTEVILKA
jgi:asparagine synthase (glutamine-hydrolysing)